MKNLTLFLHSIPSYPNAKCIDPDIDPELFFPVSTEQLQRDLPAVRKICQSCDHQPDCMKWAIDNHEEHGIWGGLTPDDRKRVWKARQMRRSQKRRAETQKIGRAASALRDQGWGWDSIASRFGLTSQYAERMVYRWRQENDGEAS